MAVLKNQRSKIEKKRGTDVLYVLVAAQIANYNDQNSKVAYFGITYFGPLHQFERNV